MRLSLERQKAREQLGLRGTNQRHSAATSCKWIKDSFCSIWNHITPIPGGSASEGYPESFVEIICDL